MTNNLKSEKMKKLLTLQTILDENTRIETISDKDILKNVLSKIIGVASYSKIKHEDIIEVTNKIFVEYGIKRY